MPDPVPIRSRGQSTEGATSQLVGSCQHMSSRFVVVTPPSSKEDRDEGEVRALSSHFTADK